ncbi:MAG: hypothetical protein U0Y10_06890 [Spirosomataceae bacterium]
MKKLIVFALAMFVASLVSFGQTKKEVSSANFSEITLKTSQRSVTKFSPETAESNKDLKKYFFKSSKANILIYVGKDNKLSYAGYQMPNGGTMQTLGINQFVNCCLAGYNAGREITSVVISCAREYLDIELQPVP